MTDNKTRTTSEDRIDFTTNAPTTGSLDVNWNHGTSKKIQRAQKTKETEPKIQIHHYDPHTVILRQSKSVNYEAPFIFLLFGNDRALLLDTGATADPTLFPLRETVDSLIADWLDQHPRDDYQLTVAHTHGHGDHVAGDPQFADRPATTVVARDEDAVREFFGFRNWPAETVEYDLGGRVLEILGSPGHHKSAVTVYDSWTGILFTGDTVLPGRLYAFDFPTFRQSLDRMVAFADTRPVTHVLGCHVEMTNHPGRDYPLGATYQPDERRPEMTTAQLTAARDAAAKVADQPGVHPFDDFVIYNEPSKAVMLKLTAGAIRHKIFGSRG